MSLGPTYFLVGLVWGPCLQGGRPRGQVPTGPEMACRPGSGRESRGPGEMGSETPGWGAVCSALQGFPGLKIETCHPQAPRGSALLAGPGWGP